MQGARELLFQATGNTRTRTAWNSLHGCFRDSVLLYWWRGDALALTWFSSRFRVRVKLSQLQFQREVENHSVTMGPRWCIITRDRALTRSKGAAMHSNLPPSSSDDERQSLLTLYRQEANASDLTCSPMSFKGQKPFPRPWASSYATLRSALSMSTGG
jgi:hypothetical protein